MNDDLVAFLHARLDEDEQTAKGLNMAARFIDGEPNFYGAGGLAAQNHWQRFSPARVLAEVDAKRRILALHHATPSPADGPADPPVTVCVECGPDTHTLWETDPRGARGDWYPCPTLRLLVLPYRDHPDYQPAWVPETEG